MFSSLISSVLNKINSGCYQISFLKFYTKATICVIFWSFIYKFKIEEWADSSFINRRKALYIGCILFGISIIILTRYSINICFLFFLIGGIQIGLYSSDLEVIPGFEMFFLLFEICLSAIIYSFFYPIMK